MPDRLCTLAITAPAIGTFPTSRQLGSRALPGRLDETTQMPDQDQNEQTRFITVTQLAAELGITPRTLRFYENIGLITPGRIGTTRAYSARDRARMVLILRGKRVGFSLKEIAEYLDLYDADTTGRSQNERLHKVVSARIDLLESQRASLDEMLSELYEYRRHAEAALGRGIAIGIASPETNPASTPKSKSNALPAARAVARTERSRP